MRRWNSAGSGSGHSHNAITAGQRLLTSQPAFGANRLRSASDPNGNQYNPDIDDGQSMSDINDDQDMPDTNGSQPTSDTNGHQTIIDGNGHQATSHGNGYQPSTVSDDDRTISDISEDQDVFNTNGDQQTSNGNGHQPTSNGTGDQSTSNGNARLPVLGVFRHPPTSSRNSHHPTSNGNNHQPTSDGQSQTPRLPEAQGLIGSNLINYNLHENLLLSNVDEDGKPLRARLGGIVTNSSITDSPRALIRRLEQADARGRAVYLEMGKLVFVGKSEWVKRALQLGGSTRE